MILLALYPVILFMREPLAESLEGSDEAEYGLFERFFHKDSFIAEETDDSDAIRTGLFTIEQ